MGKRGGWHNLWNAREQQLACEVPVNRSSSPVNRSSMASSKMFRPNTLIQEKLKQVEEGKLGIVAAMNDVFKLLDQDGLMYVMKVA